MTLGFRWRNVPLPEPHLSGLAAGIMLQFSAPWTVSLPAPAGPIGSLLVAAGLALAASAVLAAGATDMSAPAGLVVDGPYAGSRHPMYVGWTVVYVGLGLVVNSVWFFVLLPAVSVWTHLVIRREERRLDAKFGPAFRRYRAKVRRYL